MPRRHTEAHRSVRRSDAGESGIALVEVLVAIVILGFVMGSLAGSIVSSLGSIRASEDEVQATAIRNDIIEQVRALPWDAAGLCLGENGYRATHVHDATVKLTVTLHPDTCANVSHPLPLATTARNGVTYTVRTDVLWEDPDGDGDPDDKRILIELSWLSGNRTRTATTETMRTQRPSERDDSPCGVDLVQTVISPDPAALNAISAVTVSPVTMNVTSCGLAITDQVKVTYERATITGGTELITRGLTSLDGETWVLVVVGDAFINGETDFRFDATRLSDGEVADASEAVTFSGGPWSPAPVPTATPTPTPTIPVPGTDVKVTHLSSSPLLICLDGKKRNSTAITLQIVTQGNPDSVQIEYLVGSAGKDLVTEAAVSLGGGIWRLVIDAQSRTWSTVHGTTFTATARRASDGANATKSIDIAATPCGL